ncbi:hypothetical protein GCM10027577_47420 [Spirosoma fluminis]
MSDLVVGQTVLHGKQSLEAILSVSLWPPGAEAYQLKLLLGKENESAVKATQGYVTANAERADVSGEALTSSDDLT